MLRFAPAVALLCVATALPAHPQDEALNQIYGRLIAARAAGDLAGMIGPFPAEAILIDSRKLPALGGGDELQAQLASMAARLKADNASVASSYRVERRSIRKDLAIDAGYMRMMITIPGRDPMVRYARYLVAFQRAGDGWQIMGDANMPSDAAAWDAVRTVPGLRHDD